MKKYISILAAALLAAGAASAQETLTSPDGNMELRFSVKEGGVPTYEMDYKGQFVVV